MAILMSENSSALKEKNAFGKPDQELLNGGAVLFSGWFGGCISDITTARRGHPDWSF